MSTHEPNTTIYCYVLFIKHIMRSKWQLGVYSFLVSGNMKLLPVFKKVITGILHLFCKHSTSVRAQLVFPTKNKHQYERGRVKKETTVLSSYRKLHFLHSFVLSKMRIM